MMRLSNLFTKKSHHRYISVILIVQNLFHKGKQMRNLSLNTSYLCCFKNVRDKQQIACLARQMYPKQTKFFMESYNDATLEPHGYLFLDLEPETIEELSMRSNIFPGDYFAGTYRDNSFICEEALVMYAVLDFEGFQLKPDCFVVKKEFKN